MSSAAQNKAVKERCAYLEVISKKGTHTPTTLKEEPLKKWVRELSDVALGSAKVVTHFEPKLLTKASSKLSPQFFKELEPVLKFMRKHMPSDDTTVPNEVRFPTDSDNGTAMTFTVTGGSKERKGKKDHVLWHYDAKNVKGSMGQSLSALSHPLVNEDAGIHVTTKGLNKQKQPLGHDVRVPPGLLTIPFDRVGHKVVAPQSGRRVSIVAYKNAAVLSAVAAKKRGAVLIKGGSRQNGVQRNQLNRLIKEELERRRHK